GGIIVGADLALDPFHLLLEAAVEQLLIGLAAVGERRAEMELLPDLRAADLGGGGILHEVIERHRAAAAQPRLDVLDADPDVLAKARLGAGSLVHLEELLLPDLDVLAAAIELVR